MRIQLVHGAPKLVERLERRVVRRGHNIADRSDEELHALRKALKKTVGYSVEFLSSVCRDKQAKAYLHVIKKLLKHLGSLNDAVVVVALAEQARGRASAGTCASRRNASGLGGAQPRQSAQSGRKILPSLPNRRQKPHNSHHRQLAK